MSDFTAVPALVDHGHDLLSANAYLVLGTVGQDDAPWTTPVYFAADGVRDYYWVSSTESRHSANLATSPRVSLAVFDSTVPPYHGRCLYAAGEATELAGDDLEHGLRVYPGASARGGTPVTVGEVTGDAPWRLYRARATAVWVLCPREPRQPCSLHGRAEDHRERIA